DGNGVRITARRAGSATNAAKRLKPSVMRARSRGSCRRLKQTSGGVRQSADASRTKPRENERLAHTCNVPNRPPSACHAEREMQLTNMSPGGQSGWPDE